MIDPDAPREAKISRSMLMDGVARFTRQGRQTALVLTIAHNAAAKLLESFDEMARLLRELPTARQLAEVERWCPILKRAFKTSCPDRELRLPARPLLARSNTTDYRSRCAACATVTAPECLLTAESGPAAAVAVSQNASGACVTRQRALAAQVHRPRCSQALGTYRATVVLLVLAGR